MYVALYRKWRSKDFDDVVGQDHITLTLKNQIKTDRVAHAYIFCGTRGTGKTSTARIFARAVNCTNPADGEPCNKCDNCLEALNESSLDIIEIDAASNSRVENIRDLIDNIKYAPSRSKYKVYIIDEVHMLSGAAFNALLKTLEEPPKHAIFILATTDIQKVPVTILSRCQRFDFKRIPYEVMADRIKYILKSDNINADDETIRVICRLSDGAMRDALSLLDQCISFCGNNIKYDDVIKVLGISQDEYLYEMVEYMNQENTLSCLTLLSRLIQDGKDVISIINDLLMHFRNILLVKAGGLGAKEIIDISSERFDALLKLAQQININKIMFFINVLSSTLQEIKTVMNKRLYAEMAIIKMCSPEMETDKELVNERLNILASKVQDISSRIKSGAFVTNNDVSQENNSEMKKVDGTQVQRPVKPKKLFKNDAINYCIKNWETIIDNIKESPDFQKSSWVLLSEAKVANYNDTQLCIVANDRVSEMSLKKEIEPIKQLLADRYGVSVDIKVTTAKQAEECRDDMEYIVENIKENFIDIPIEIKNE